MRQPDKSCLDAFPEMMQSYGRKPLENASRIGSYIFFEDYFNEFIEKNKNNGKILLRAADYIEGLAQSENSDIQNLVEIGILEGLVNRDVSEIAKLLKPNSKKLLKQATSRTKIDAALWRLNR